MAERNYPIPDAPVYDPNIRALQNSDEANADTVFNPLLMQLISNIHAVKLLADGKADGESMQAKLTEIANTFNAINIALNGKAASSHTHTASQVGAAAASHSHSAATTSAAGFMAAADKSKLDGIAAKATANAASATTPKPLGTASAGSEAAFARGDHTHPKPSLADLGAAAASHSHTAAQVGALSLNGYISAGQKSDQSIGVFATAEGYGNISTGNGSHAEGLDNNATGAYSHAEGKNTVATSQCDHSEGRFTEASGSYSHAEGYYTVANNCASHVSGHYNKTLITGGATTGKTGDSFVIGNGSSDNSRSNAFRVTFAGQVYGLSAFNTSGADYAEYFEWLDANPDSEDRVGFFVNLQGEKISKANAGEYILGIVSGNPCIIGNSDEDWLGRYEHDEFNRFEKIEIETPVTEMRTKEVPVLDEDGNPTGEIRIENEEVPTGEVIKGWDYKANSDYDPTQKYIERKDRPEWSAIGMLGVLSVRDDGSCQVNGFCQCADGGIATAAEKYIPGQTYRVIARVTENIVKVVFR